MAGGCHIRQCTSRLRGMLTFIGPTKPTSFPASIVAFSFFPSSEPEATMALSMSPVAKWQTQKFLASLGAWGGEDKNKDTVTTAGPGVRLCGCEPGPAVSWLHEWQKPIPLPVTEIKVPHMQTHNDHKIIVRMTWDNTCKAQQCT